MIAGTTRILGVIGNPVEHSSSPNMHNAAVSALGLDYAYVALRVRQEDLERAVAGIRALNFVGINVTVPHKVAVLDWLDEVSTDARVIGAVNTVTNRDGHLCGYNTDAGGFVESLRYYANMTTLPSRVGLLGAGGAARAILYALLRRDEVEDILLLNRTVARAEDLAGEMGGEGRVQTGRLDLQGCAALRHVGLIINSTSLGMHPKVELSPLSDSGCLHEGIVVVDIVYNPLRTLLLKQAELAGACSINGLGMLVHQGALAFELWTGQTPPVAVMQAAALKRFAAE